MPKKQMKQRSKRMVISRDFPSRYIANPIFRRKFRYQAQASESKDADYVTMGSLQNLMGILLSGTTGTTLFSAVRLRSVEVWADSSATQTLSTIGLDWLSSDTPNTQVNATGNAFRPAHFKAIPPKNSVAGRWYAIQLLAPGTPTSLPSTTPYAFSLISTVAGAICDVEFEFTLFDYDTLNNPPNTTNSGGTVGTLVCNSYLDNTSVSLGNGTKNWLLQGMSNISSFYISTI
jgi:hypothetical protein